MAQPEMKAESRRVVEHKLRVLEDAMKRRLKEAEKRAEEQRKKD